jgi:hypothetical protein
MGSPTIRYRPLEGEPAELRCRPLLISIPLGAARLALHACLTLVRLTLSAVISLIIAVVLFSVALGVIGGRSPVVGDAGDYLAGVLRVSAGWLDSDPTLPEGTSGLISETSSTSVARPTPSPGSTAALVATLSQLAPSELREVYQQAVPMMQQYDALLGDVQSALENDRDLDAFFADVQPWLQQAEAEPGNP